MCGSNSDLFNNALISSVLNTVWTKGLNQQDTANLYAAAMGAMIGIAPRDELEGMLAGQLLASHFAAMECYRRAMLPEQTADGRQTNLSQANKLSRTHVTLLEALNRHRGKGQQKMTVEHVHVYPGGQAVVGVVEPGANGQTVALVGAPRGAGHKIADQPHAITHAPGEAVRRDNPEGNAVPVTGHA